MLNFHFQIIDGEIYKVDDKMLTNLDVLERHPEFYRREVSAFD